MYQVVNGTSYDSRTPKQIVDILERYRENRQFIILHYGDTETGKDWLEEHDVRGRIGRSGGTEKVPLMVESGQIGGPQLLDHCIVRIRTHGKELYRHPLYHTGTVEVKDKEVLVNGQVHARFKTNRQALSWKKRMGL